MAGQLLINPDYDRGSYAVGKLVARLFECGSLMLGLGMVVNGDSAGYGCGLCGVAFSESLYQIFDQLDSNSKFSRLEQNILDALVAKAAIQKTEKTDF